MFRLSSSFFLSFTIHALIALLAVGIYQEVRLHSPAAKKAVCVSLTHCVETLPVAPKQARIQPPPILPKKIEVEKPPPPKPIERPKPIVKVEPKPVVRPPPVIEDIVEPAPVEAVAVVETKIDEVADLKESTTASASQPEIESDSAATPTVEESYLEEHLAEIARLLQKHLYYPRSARKRGITGEVIVAFELLSNGEARAIEVRSGSRDLLNRAAITTIERLSGEFPRPQEPISLQVPIRYQLQ